MTKPSKNGPQFTWAGDKATLKSGWTALRQALEHLCLPVFAVDDAGKLMVSDQGGVAAIRESVLGSDSYHLPLKAMAFALRPQDLGSKGFKKDFKLTYAYVAGAMANGITSVEMVKAAGNAGMIGFFGAGGLNLPQLEKAVNQLAPLVGTMPLGFNLIHSPNDPQLENAVVDLYLRSGIRCVSASAYLDLTLPLVRFRVHGIYRLPDGRIVCPNKVMAKVSRVEVARKFFAPPPQKFLDQLLAKGYITGEQAQLARHIPMAQDLTAEADSGGHTDNRPAISLLPTMMALRDRAMAANRYADPLRVGLAGGIATPQAAAGAFAMGAAYVLTGSVNQSCIEADTAPQVKKMLADAQQADVIMAPAADMFEMGVKLQVLKRGTMFAMRAAKLYDLYCSCRDFDDIAPSQRQMVERDLLRCSFDQAWDQTRRFFQERDPSQITRAEKDPRHKMALVFRSYLGLSSLWAKTGAPDRQLDYQIWCGPAMGAFNNWVDGSFLKAPGERKTALVGLNLLCGAAYLLRCRQLNFQGLSLPPELTQFTPRTESDLHRMIS